MRLNSLLQAVGRLCGVKYDELRVGSGENERIVTIRAGLKGAALGKALKRAGVQDSELRVVGSTNAGVLERRSRKAPEDNPLGPNAEKVARRNLGSR